MKKKSEQLHQTSIQDTKISITDLYVIDMLLTSCLLFLSALLNMCRIVFVSLGGIYFLL